MLRCHINTSRNTDMCLTKKGTKNAHTYCSLNQTAD